MADPVTPVAEVEILKTKPVAPEVPGAGGWVPDKKTPLWAALFVGISTSAVPALLDPNFSWRTIVASVIAGGASGIGTYFSMRSAGPRKSS